MPVPDTNTFSLQDVIDIVNPASNDLLACFAAADANKFDPYYEGDKDSLLNFRNYDSDGPPTGAEVFYWYGDENGSSWDFVLNEDNVFALTKNSDHLLINVANSIYSGREMVIQPSARYVAGAGKKLHLIYEIADISSGEIFKMRSCLYDSNGSGFDTSAILEWSKPLAGGELHETSLGETSGTTSYYPSVYLEAWNYPQFTLKIYGLYYL